jgi:hypothetical protein
MSKFHGEQYWSQLRHQTLQDWHQTSEDDLETLNAIRHSREVRARDLRTRARRERRGEVREYEA